MIRSPTISPNDKETTPSASQLKASREEPRTPTPGSHSGFSEAQGQLLTLITSDARDGHVEQLVTASGNVEQDPSPPPSTNSSVSGSAEDHQPIPKFRPLPISRPTTPANRGTAFMAQARSGVVDAGKLAPYIRRDINLKKHRSRIRFLDYVKFALKSCAVDRSPDLDATALLNKVVEVTTALYNDPKFDGVKEKLKEYCQPRSDERDGYKTFANCINDALELLKEEKFPDLRELSSLQDLILHVQDPKVISHNYAKKAQSDRKPDMTLLTKALRHMLIRESRRLRWLDCLSPWEIKLLGHGGFPLPPGEYGKKAAESVEECYALHDSGLTRDDRIHASKLLSVAPGGDPLTNPNDRRFDDDDVFSSHSGSFSSRSHLDVPSEPSQPSSSSGGSKSSGVKRQSDSQAETSSQHSKKVKLHDEKEELLSNEQVSAYGCEMLCRGIYTLHSINILVMDDLISLWWFDRQNVIQTSNLNFVQDMPFFLALLVAFQRFNLPEWGVEPSLVPPLAFTKLDAMSKSVKITFDSGITGISLPAQPTLHGPVLKGRATCIIDTTTKEKALQGQKLVIKAYWPETTRQSEATIIQKAYKILQESGDEDEKKLVKHLPKLLGSRDFSGSDTGKILREFHIPAALKSPNPRVLRLLLFRKLVSLEEITNETDFMNAWLQCLKCHYALWKNGIQHGDISAWNIMWDGKEKCGILNDFDLAADKTNGKSTPGHGGERTGTLPFMARAILKPAFLINGGERLYLYELESFIWVLMWFCLQGINLEGNKEWRRGSPEHVLLTKTQFLSDWSSFQGNPKYPRACENGRMLLFFLDEIDNIRRKLEMLSPSLEFKVDPQAIYAEVVTMMDNTRSYRFKQALEFTERVKSSLMASLID